MQIPGIMTEAALLAFGWAARGSTPHTDYYLSTSGSDATGHGTLARPWATIAA